MSRGAHASVVGALAVLLAAPAARGEPGGVTDLDGASRDPLRAAGAAVVLVFVQPECPISNRYAPELARLAADYAEAGVRVWTVYAGDVAVDEARAHHEDYFPHLPALLDPEAELAARAGVEVTPEAAVFLPDGTLAYRGRIDDRYVSFGRQRARPTRRDLVAALDAVLEGRLPEVRETRAIGCFLVRR